MTAPTTFPLTAFDLAQRYTGIRELSATGQDHPLVQWWFSCCGWSLDTPDETPWCSAFVNGIAWELRLPQSRSAAARSWLTVGKTVALADALIGNDVVILKRGAGQAGPEILTAPGHVGFFAGYTPGSPSFLLLGGNQGNAVSQAYFPVKDILGIRRLA